MSSSVENQKCWTDPLTGSVFHDLTGREHAIIHALNTAIAERDEAQSQAAERAILLDEQRVLADRHREALEELRQFLAKGGVIELAHMRAVIDAALTEDEQPETEDLRDLAVEIVDQHYGYTVDQVSNPEIHQDAYEMVERGMRRALAARPAADRALERISPPSTTETADRELRALQADASSVIGLARLYLRDGKVEQAETVLIEHAENIDRLFADAIQASSSESECTDA